MIRFVCLLDSSTKAEKAVKALNEAQLAEGNLQVIESLPESKDQGDNIDPVAKEGGPGEESIAGTLGSTDGIPFPAPSVPVNVSDPLKGIDLTEEAESFFRHGVQEGGVLVLAEVAEDKLEEAKTVLRNQGGRFHIES